MAASQTRSPCYREQRPSEMESTGFVVYSASSDGTGIGHEVVQCLYSRPKIERDTLVYGRGDTKICETFLQAGIDTFSAKIREAIGGVDFLLRQGPVIVRSHERHMWGVRLAHPSRNAVSIFRDLSVTNESSVAFKLYPLDLPKEEVMKAQPVVRKLRPSDILFVKGSVRMEIEIPPQGSFVWQGNSAGPMGDDILNPEVFEFMKI